MRSLVEDLRFAWRTLWKTPGFTATAVLTLALGIGATTAIFTLVSQVLLRPLPYPSGERIVRVWETFPSGKGSVSRPNFDDWKAAVRGLEQLSTASSSDYNLVADGEAERMVGVSVSEDFMALLGVHPAAGRLFTRDAFQGTGGTEVILDHGVWQRRFGGADVLGKTVSLSGRPYTVVGVMPEGFEFPWFQKVQLWLPHDRSRVAEETRGRRFLQVYGKLADGATLPGARAELETVVKGIAAAHPEVMKDRGVFMQPLHEVVTAAVAPTLWLLFAVVLLVLLIACFNVANMLLARSAARGGEIAVRVALGASRRRLVRLLLTEGVVLALLGGAGALLIASWAVDACAAWMRVPQLFRLGVDASIFGFAAAVALGSTLIFALAPALRASRVDLAAALKDAGGKVAGGRTLLRSSFVCVEVALSFAVLVCAGLLLRSFERISDVDPGFDAGGVMTLRIALPTAKYADEPAVAGFYDRLLAEVRAIPGVERAGAVNFLPLSQNNWNGNFHIVGRETPPGIDPVTEFMFATPDYFATLHVPLVAGRVLGPGDRAGTPKVVVINQTMANRFFGADDPIGKQIGLGADDPPREIVGVVADTRRWGLGADPVPETFMPLAQEPVTDMTLVARFARPPGAREIAALRAAVARVDPEQAVYDVAALDEIVRDSLGKRRVSTQLLAGFAAVALLLAAIGLYGVVSVLVSQRTRELGIRIALGARAGEVRGLVLRHGLGLVAIGLVVGTGAAFALVRLFAGLLYGVTASDPVTFVATAAVLAGTTLVACWVPARRATRIDPMIALRAE